LPGLRCACHPSFCAGRVRAAAAAAADAVALVLPRLLLLLLLLLLRLLLLPLHFVRGLGQTFESQQVASDCLWSDPARDEQEMVLDESG
jgi:hypothetical protein